jgi:hypothetical protein
VVIKATTLSDHLAFLQGELRSLTSAAERVVQGLSAEQLTWRPAPNAWSIAECLDHLAVAGAAFRSKIEPAVRAVKKRTTGEVAYRPGFLARAMLKGNGPVVTKKMRSPKVFRPSETADATSVTSFRAEQRELLDLIERARGIDLTRVHISSPMTRLFRFNVAEALHIIVVHEQRHIAQAERVRAAMTV